MIVCLLVCLLVCVRLRFFAYVCLSALLCFVVFFVPLNVYWCVSLFLDFLISLNFGFRCLSLLCLFLFYVCVYVCVIVFVVVSVVHVAKVTEAIYL